MTDKELIARAADFAGLTRLKHDRFGGGGWYTAVYGSAKVHFWVSTHSCADSESASCSGACLMVWVDSNPNPIMEIMVEMNLHGQIIKHQIGVHHKAF